MLVKSAGGLPYSAVTPRTVYLNRRRFLAAALGGGAAAGSLLAGTKLPVAAKSPFSTTEPVTSYDKVTNYNNFYEFGTQKGDPAKYAKALVTSPWAVSVEGAVAKPVTLDLDFLMSVAPLEERIYRHRCVEGWSMVVPWIGFSLSALIKRVEPLSNAKFVAFESRYDKNTMLAERWAGIPFPYVEGLRMDEAMHPLTMLSFGMYGEMLPKQDGAPVRLTVPWKYGFKSIKSIVKIRFVEKQPHATWNLATPSEYGFYSNVNPKVDHPRWSQARENRLGEFFKRPTLLFNGYNEVASLYAGMDLRKYY